MGSKKKIGLVLSGGGTRSLAHIGLIKALEEENIYPEMISGTSGGALVGALYASGVAPEDMLHFFEEVPMFKLSLFTFKKPGVMDSSKYPEIFKKFLKIENFEDLRLPLTVTTTNLLTGRVEYFSKGDLLKPLIASSAYPPYFSPVEIGENIYTDGGILNNFPTEPILAETENILGSFVSPIICVTKKDINSTFKLLQRIYNIGTDASYYAKFQQCNYVFIPTDIQQIGTLDTKNIHKAFDMGYEQAKAQMPQILASLNH